MSNLSYELYLAAKQEIVVARMELASTRKELEDLRVLHKIAWTNEKKLTEALEELRGHACRNCGGFTNIQACSCDKNEPTDSAAVEKGDK